jgi:hypothetical protein
VVVLWSYTLIEYVAHRWMFHYQFKNLRGVEGYLHRIFDSVHNGHHANPLDGDHISGCLWDLLMPPVVVAAPLSFVAPVYTLTVLLGGNVQGYVITEWIHLDLEMIAVTGSRVFAFASFDRRTTYGVGRSHTFSSSWYRRKPRSFASCSASRR